MVGALVDTRGSKCKLGNDGDEPTIVAKYTNDGNPSSDSWYPLQFTAKASDYGGLAVRFDNDTSTILDFTPSPRPPHRLTMHSFL